MGGCNRRRQLSVSAALIVTPCPTTLHKQERKEKQNLLIQHREKARARKAVPTCPRHPMSMCLLLPG